MFARVMFVFINEYMKIEEELLMIAMNKTPIQFHLSQEDQARLEGLPWHVPVDQWLAEGVQLLTIRRGESRHPVVFVEREGVRYAIKETTPHMAEREARFDVDLGLGAGYVREEFEAAELPYPTAGQRVEHLEHVTTYMKKHLPNVPILIAGNGPDTVGAGPGTVGIGPDTVDTGAGSAGSGPVAG